MRVCKWGNSLAIRLPAIVFEALDLKEGQDIDIQAGGPGSMKIEKKPGHKKLIARLRKYRGRLPADFKWDRLEAAECVHRDRTSSIPTSFCTCSIKGHEPIVQKGWSPSER